MQSERLSTTHFVQLVRLPTIPYFYLTGKAAFRDMQFILGARSLIPGIDQPILALQTWFGRFPESVAPK